MREFGLASVESLDDVLSIMNGEMKAKALKAKTKLKNLVADVKSVNDSNNDLIKQSLDIIEFNMNVLTSIGQEETSYGNKADVKFKDKKRSIFDAKV